jgi:hypothetical protein
MPGGWSKWLFHFQAGPRRIARGTTGIERPPGTLGGKTIPNKEEVMQGKDAGSHDPYGVTEVGIP